MKKFLSIAGIVAFCAVLAYVVYTDFTTKPKNPMLAKNLEALSQSEGGGGSTTYFFRQDEDCEYHFTGKKNSTLSFSIGGQLITIKLDENGEYTYVYKYGRTRCTTGGHEVCEARYCPPMIYQ